MAPPPRIVTLVVDDPRGVLPAIEVASPWWMESGPVADAALVAFGIDVSVVRLLDGGSFPGGPVTYLVEVHELDRALLSPWPGDLPDDERRPGYARVGGIRSLADWIDDALGEAGARRTAPVEQVRTWNLSCLLRVSSTLGELWLKAVPEFFDHEAAVISALASVDSTLVPEVIAARPGAILMRTAVGEDGYGVGPDVHFDAVRRLHEASGQLDLAVLDHVPRRDLAHFERSLADLSERHGGDLSEEEREQLGRLIAEAGDRWQNAGPTDLTLVHGDLHGGNLRVSSGTMASPPIVSQATRSRIIDWGDASISHPLFELAVLDSYSPGWPPAAADRWLGLLGVGRAEWAAFRPLAAIRLAITYRAFCDQIEASEQIYHRNDIVPAIRRGLSSLD